MSRAFFALWPDEPCRLRLQAGVAGRLDAAVGRPLDPRDWHVTLRFLGSIDAPRLSTLRAQIAEVRASAFELRFDGIEYWAQAQLLVLVAADAVPREARDLAQALEGLARATGLAPEERPLRAHITLVRGVRKAPAPGVTGRLPSAGAPDLAFRATEFHLAESIVPEPGRVSERRYRTLQSWPLLA